MRVLIVEDDPVLATSLATGLRAEGYAVETAADGEDGLWHATEEAFDVVVLDIMLPRRNGFSVLAELRKRGSKVPVLMLTAKDGEWDQAEALDTGADDYLVKPFSYPVLLARLRALIRRSAGAASATIDIDGVSVDTVARRCWREGVEIELTAREYLLLEYFVHRPGVVVSKMELLERVWDHADNLDPNVVEVYVSYLRRKLDANTGRPLLRTVRGIGYRFGGDDGAP